MNPERKEGLNLISATWTHERRRSRLGGSVLNQTTFRYSVTAGQLNLLGNPPPGAVKFFLTAEIKQRKVTPHG